MSLLLLLLLVFVLIPSWPTNQQSEELLFVCNDCSEMDPQSSPYRIPTNRVVFISLSIPSFPPSKQQGSPRPQTLHVPIKHRLHSLLSSSKLILNPKPHNSFHVPVYSWATSKSYTQLFEGGGLKKEIM